MDGDRNTSLQLKDVSKFAQTSVNGSLLNTGQREVSLNPGDVIQFGACRDSFTVHYKKIVAYIADLNDRPELQSLAFRTGIPITDAIEYSDIFVCDEVDETNLKVRKMSLLRITSVAHPSNRQTSPHYFS